MLTIYHAAGTRSMRVIWLCHELDLPLTIETVPFTAEFRASDEWRAKSPSGKVPAMEDDGLVMFESGAMVDYILDRYGEGRLRPLPGSHEDAIYRQWCWFAEATLARPIGDVAQHTHVRAPEDRIPAVAEDGRVRALTFMRVVNDRLSEGNYLLPSGFSAADIMMGYSLMLAERVGISDPSLDRLGVYFSMLKARSHYQTAASA
jgi:glutathione S-transferase